MNWQKLQSATNDEILVWAESQPWCAPMASCQQDPLWHAEGDVWTHTKMVLDELYQLPEFHELSRPDQLILTLTTLFHDTGKPETTYLDPDSGHIRSPKHAAVSARIARLALIDLGCDFVTREHICHLVLYHGWPHYFGKRRRAEDEVIRVSWHLRNLLLYLFVLADLRGRESTDKTIREEPLELWRIQSEELGCFNRPFAFQNKHARFLYYRNQLDNLHYVPHEDYRCRMTIMCGLPGAGKDTWLNKNHPELPVVSLDSIRHELSVDPTGNQGVVIQEAKKRCRWFLRNRKDFAVSATHVSRQVRKLWIDLGADYGARIEIAYIEPPLETILEQNRSRSGSRVVPTEVIHRLVNKLDPPTLTECHDLIVDCPR